MRLPRRHSRPHWLRPVLLLFAVGATAHARPTESFSGRVVAVLDGDTIDVMRDGKAVRVRLAGVDCPEKRQAYGQKAKRFTSRLAFGWTVTVEYRRHDRYGRVIGKVRLPDSRALERELVRAGLAWWYRKYAPRDRDLARLEEKARMARFGLWADPQPVAPWDFRREGRTHRPAPSLRGSTFPSSDRGLGYLGKTSWAPCSTPAWRFPTDSPQAAQRYS